MEVQCGGQGSELIDFHPCIFTPLYSLPRKLRGAGESFPCWGSLRGQRPLKVLVFKGFDTLRGPKMERMRFPLLSRFGERRPTQGVGGERGASPPY
jgi:hypothetical protein